MFTTSSLATPALALRFVAFPTCRNLQRRSGMPESPSGSGVRLRPADLGDRTRGGLDSGAASDQDRLARGTQVRVTWGRQKNGWQKNEPFASGSRAHFCAVNVSAHHLFHKRIEPSQQLARLLRGMATGWQPGLRGADVVGVWLFCGLLGTKGTSMSDYFLVAIRRTTNVQTNDPRRSAAVFERGGERPVPHWRSLPSFRGPCWARTERPRPTSGLCWGASGSETGARMIWGASCRNPTCSSWPSAMSRRLAAKPSRTWPTRRTATRTARPIKTCENCWPAAISMRC
jgi:hypothetical protein